MKIALDVDGVVTEHYPFWSFFTETMMKAGHEIYIITDIKQIHRDFRIAELKHYKIHYKEMIITPDKRSFCEELEIDFAIDDMPEYYYDAKNVVKFAIVTINE